MNLTSSFACFPSIKINRFIRDYYWLICAHVPIEFRFECGRNDRRLFGGDQATVGVKRNKFCKVIIRARHVWRMEETATAAVAAATVHSFECIDGTAEPKKNRSIEPNTWPHLIEINRMCPAFSYYCARAMHFPFRCRQCLRSGTRCIRCFLHTYSDDDDDNASDDQS